MGNPKIEEKMNLDIKVARLRTIFGSYQDNRIDLQNKIAKVYPEKIQNITERINGLEKDIVAAQANKTEEFSQMTVEGKVYTDKKEAETAFLESCRNLKANQKEKPVGNYRWFNLSASFDNFSSCYCVTLKNNLSHKIEISSDIFGNITRLDNALNNLSKKLDVAKSNLEEVNHNLKTAKDEVDKPFLQLSELREKEARLEELNAELSMENREVSEDKEEKAKDLSKEKKSNDISL